MNKGTKSTEKLLLTKRKYRKKNKSACAVKVDPELKSNVSK